MPAYPVKDFLPKCHLSAAASLSNNPRIFNDTMILSNDASLCALKLTCRSSFLCQEGIELMTI